MAEVCSSGREVESVGLLSLPTILASSGGFLPKERGEKLARLGAQKRAKRAAHDLAVREAVASLASVSEKLEGKVVETSFALKAALEAVDSELAEKTAASSFFSSSGDESECLTVEETWVGLEGMLKKRTVILKEFGDSLESLERERSLEASALLASLARRLSKIGYESAGTIERLIDAEASEVNAVVVSNRKSHAELMALLEVAHIEKGQTAIDEWRARREEWRAKRHQKALDAFRADLKSSDFLRPVQRSTLFESVRTRQLESDDTRRRLVEGLLSSSSSLFQQEEEEDEKKTAISSSSSNARGGVVSPPQIIETTKTKLKEVYDSNVNAVSEVESQLETIGAELRQKADEKRERLRRELHEYGALAEEPDLAARADFFETRVVENKDMEAYLRAAGGLKAEVKALIRECRSPLVYRREVERSLKRVSDLKRGRDLEAVLDAQGKSLLRTQLCDTLEKLRAATKHDVAPLLPLMERQVDDLAKSTGLDPALTEEFATAASELAAISADLIMRAGTSSKMSARSGLSAATSVQRSSKKSMSIAQRKKGPGSAYSERSTSSQSSFFRGPEVNMLEVRAVQKRVALHARSCELPVEVFAQLDGVESDLKQKLACVEKVDECVRTNCDSLVDEIDSTHRVLSRHAVVFLEADSLKAYQTSVKVCDFFQEVKSRFRDNETQKKAVDERMLDDLFDLVEASNDTITSLEGSITLHLDTLRKAADDTELDQAFRTVQDNLEALEVEYRDYHSKTLLKAAEHPPTAEKQFLDFFHNTLCPLFDLKHIQDPAGEETLCLGGAHFTAEVDLPTIVERRFFRDEDDDDNLLPLEEEEEEEEDRAPEFVSRRERTDEDALFWRDDFVPLTQEQLADMGEGRLKRYLDVRDAAFLRHPFYFPTVSQGEDEATATPEDPFRPGDPKRDEYVELKDEIVERAKKRDAENAAKAAEIATMALYVRTVPEDADGPCLVRAEAPERKAVIEMISTLRNEKVGSFVRDAKERSVKLARLAEERAKEVTEELEERLRTHWPRRGRAEVSYRQPREGELVAHTQRKNRHVRLIKERQNESWGLFSTEIDALVNQFDAFEARIACATASLPSKTSLAGLQGSHSSWKKLVAVFADESSKTLDRIVDAYDRKEPAKLIGLNEAMLKSTRVIADGGEYSEREALELKKSLSILSEAIEASRVAKIARVQSTREKLAKSLDFADDFRRHFDDCLQELSLREGLGAKFGAPRRSAQERLRTEQTRDETAAAELDALLDALEKKAASSSSEDPPEDTQLPELLAARLREIRVRVVGRGATLDCFVKESPRLEEEKDPAQTLEAKVDAIEATCREETRALYEKEGKGDRLPAESTGVPEAAEAWLKQAKHRMLGEYRDRARRVFRDQIRRLETLVAADPNIDPILGAPGRAAFSVAVLELARADAERLTKDTDMSKVHAGYEKAKVANHESLRPRLGLPDFEDELVLLCENEKKRSEEHLESAESNHSQLLQTQFQVARSFVTRLSTLVADLSTLLDGAPVSTDLADVFSESSDDESRRSKHKSLKRLRKAQRVQARRLEQGLEDPETNRDWPGLDASVLAEACDGDDPDLWRPILEHAARPVPALVTTAHRALFKARDAAFAKFRDHFQLSLQGIRTRHADLLSREAEWRLQWASLVKSLISDTDNLPASS